MIPFFGAILVASLVGSTHCIGMCGAFATVAIDAAGKVSRPVGTLIAYHLGRLTTYTAMGAAVGSIGAGLDTTAALVGVQRLSIFLSAVLLAIMIVTRAMREFGVKLPSIPAPAIWLTLVERAHHAAWALGPVPRAAAIGLVTTLLPCGWLYAFAAVAAGTASPLLGAAVMAVFWIGTVPALSLVGAGAKLGIGRLSPRLSLAATCVMFGLSLASLAFRGDYVGMSLPKPAQGGFDVTMRKPVIEKPQCCGEETIR